MNTNQKLERLFSLLADRADFAFFPFSADLQYLTGIPREIPSFGAIMHPGAWVEGLWVAPGKMPILALTRMSAEFGGREGMEAIDVRLLGDHDDPITFAGGILKQFGIGRKARVAVSERTYAETLVGLNTLISDLSLTSATSLLRPMRAIKTDEEIAMMRRAGAITEAAFADTIAMMKHGMTELDAISEVNHQLRRHGSLGQSFPTTLYVSAPHHPLIFGKPELTQNRAMTPPITILFDFGAIADGFCYDFGRTVFFGEPSAEALAIHRLVMDSQRAGIAALRAGKVSASAVDRAAREVIEAAGFGEAFRHRLGHGIGLDVHEPPFLTASDDSLLQENMLFTVEPSITQFADFSARVEDIIRVGPDGGDPLTKGWQELVVIA